MSKSTNKSTKSKTTSSRTVKSSSTNSKVAVTSKSAVSKSASKPTSSKVKKSSEFSNVKIKANTSSTPIRSKKRKKKIKLKIKNLKFIISTVLILGFAVFGAIIAYVAKIIVTSPDITTVIVAPKGYTTFIYDENGKEVDRLHNSSSNRVYVEIDKIPVDLQNAVICMEDKRFYEHDGIDYKGLARALIVDICSFSFKEGASTLTQQLIKNNVLTADKKLDRKIREMYLATVLEKDLKKEYDNETAKKIILELYLNTIHLGKGCYGVQAASNRYFGKDVSELNLDECTVLASIIQTPAKLEPIGHADANNNRRKIVLKYMLDQDMITKEQYEASLNANPYENVNDYNITYTKEDMSNNYFVDTLIEEVTKDLMNQKGLSEDLANQLIYTGGLKIYSTMSKKVQNAIDSVFSDESSSFATTAQEYQLIYNLDLQKPDGTPKYYQKIKYIKKNDEETVNNAINEIKSQLMEEGDKILNESHYLIIQPQASMVVIDYRTGEVKGLSGGRGTKTISRGLNRATQSTRQAGSTFKVLAAFVPAIDMKLQTAATVFDDVPYYLHDYDNKEISNWYSHQDYAYRGLSNLRDGTRDSMNIIAVKSVMNVGLENSFNYLKKFGFSTLVSARPVGNMIYTDKSPSVALGGLTDGVTVLELTAAYGAIANGGVLNTPIFYTKVTDINDNILLTKNTTTSKVIEDSTAYIATTMMRDVITSGTGGSASVGGQYIAGKTGTTSDSKDLTFVGYSPYYVGGIWVGHDQPKVITGSQSIHTQAWSKVMTKVHSGLGYKEFPMPSSVVTASVCAESGLLAVPGLCDCDQRGNRIYTEYFAEGTVPTEVCNIHVRADVINVDGTYYLSKFGFSPGNADVQNLVFIKRPVNDDSYYDVNIKHTIEDSKYELPTLYYDPYGFGYNDNNDDEFDDYKEDDDDDDDDNDDDDDDYDNNRNDDNEKEDNDDDDEDDKNNDNETDEDDYDEEDITDASSENISDIDESVNDFEEEFIS